MFKVPFYQYTAAKLACCNFLCLIFLQFLSDMKPQFAYANISLFYTFSTVSDYKETLLLVSTIWLILTFFFLTGSFVTINLLGVSQIKKKNNKSSLIFFWQRRIGIHQR